MTSRTSGPTTAGPERNAYSGPQGSRLIIRTCDHTEHCRCDRIEFRVRPLRCSADPKSGCYGYPLGFDKDYWTDTTWGRLFRFRCSTCGYTNNVDARFMGQPMRVRVA